ncbi:cytochrome c5 family protein [Alteromonadaceae bacterium M269]|nr:cytochrome c5 family protein [Alteromonadaceae bacterium M269]
MKTIIALLAGVFVSAVVVAQDNNEDIAKRIMPVGKVHVAGAQAAAAADAGPRSGSDVYNASCVACHGAGVLGAPKKGDAAGWGPRLEAGFDTVWQNALNGKGAMPPRGTCGNCSDDDIKAAIEFMIEGL